MWSLLQAATFIALVSSEPFYQRRDHLDQSRYLKTHNDNVVKDKDDAKVSSELFFFFFHPRNLFLF